MGRRQQPNDRTVVERVDPLVGAVLAGRYRLEFRLASGGFGAIYRARHVSSNLELAVKVVHARLANDPGIAARFRREGETLTTLRSQHTIAAYEFGETPNGMLFIVLELLRGVNLFERFRAHGPIPWPRMAGIARGVCDSLAEAHAHGVVHRDLKPTNLHLEKVGDDEDFVKVLDFGIAKILQSSSLDRSDLTTAGLMIGTLDYMAPEQMLGGEITGATDLYTLGIVIYEMIAGVRPFGAANTPAAALAASLANPAPLSSRAIIPAELDRIVMRCLARETADRYATADELAADLDRLVAGRRKAGRAARPLPDPDSHGDEATTVAAPVGARLPSSLPGLAAVRDTAPDTPRPVPVARKQAADSVLTTLPGVGAVRARTQLTPAPPLAVAKGAAGKAPPPIPKTPPPPIPKTPPPLLPVVGGARDDATTIDNPANWPRPVVISAPPVDAQPRSKLPLILLIVLVIAAFAIGLLAARC